MPKKKPAPKKGAKPQRTIEQRLALLEKQHTAALELQKETLEQLANALIRIEQLEAGQTYSYAGEIGDVTVQALPLHEERKPAPSSWWDRWFRTH